MEKLQTSSDETLNLSSNEISLFSTTSQTSVDQNVINVEDKSKPSNSDIKQLENAINTLKTYLKESELKQHKIIEKLFDTQTKTKSGLYLKLEYSENNTGKNSLIMETNIQTITKLPKKFFQKIKN